MRVGSASALNTLSMSVVLPYNMQPNGCMSRTVAGFSTFFGMTLCGPTAGLASHHRLFATSLEAYIISNNGFSR